MTRTRRPASEHNMTFQAADAAASEAMQASRIRGGIVKNEQQRNPDPEPEWLYWDADQFIRWLESQGL